MITAARATVPVSLILFLCISGCAAVEIHPEGPTPHKIQTRWQVQLTEPAPFAYFLKETAQPGYALDGRLVVAGSQNGEIVAAWANSGRIHWRFQAHGKIRSGPSISGRQIFIGTTDGQIHNLDLGTGVSNWDSPYRTVGAITSAPAVSKDRIVFQNNENRTYALDRKTGNYLWDHGRPRPEFFTIQGEGGAVIDGDRVYAGYDDGVLVALKLSDGATLWSKNLAASEQHFVDIDSRPLVVGDTVYAAVFNVGLYAIGKEHGNVRWLHRSIGTLGPAVSGDTLYISTGTKEILAVDRKTGKLQWRLRFGHGTLSVPQLYGSLLWVSTGNAAVSVDAKTGMVRARLAVEDGQSAPIASKNGWLHMVTNSGALVGARLH